MWIEARGPTREFTAYDTGIALRCGPVRVKLDAGEQAALEGACRVPTGRPHVVRAKVVLDAGAVAGLPEALRARFAADVKQSGDAGFQMLGSTWSAEQTDDEIALSQRDHERAVWRIRGYDPRPEWQDLPPIDPDILRAATEAETSGAKRAATDRAATDLLGIGWVHA